MSNEQVQTELEPDIDCDRFTSWQLFIERLQHGSIIGEHAFIQGSSGVGLTFLWSLKLVFVVSPSALFC